MFVYVQNGSFVYISAGSLVKRGPDCNQDTGPAICETMPFPQILQSQCRLHKINEWVFSCLDLTYALCPKSHMFQVLAPPVSRVTHTWICCLNVIAFVSKQISVWNGSCGDMSPPGPGTGQNGFEMPSTPTLFSFVILEGEEGLWKTLRKKHYSKWLTTTKKKKSISSQHKEIPKCHSQICNMENLNHWKIMH